MAAAQRRNENRQAPMTQNEAISKEQQLGFVLGQLNTREEEIAAVLPADMPFAKFHATINQALRTNPDVLECHGPSIVNACVKAAYDGLRIDGREAAISVDNVKYQKNPDRYRKEARYMPMVFGLRKQILQSGLVDDVFTTLVWEKEPFQVIGGLNPDILHTVLPDTDRGSKLKAVYSVAVLKTGHRTFEVMWRKDVEEVRAAAKTEFVWKAWEGEMWRKTVLRRHRKSLPSTRDIVDMEARELFPQFTQAEPHPQIGNAPPRPTRQSVLSAPVQSFDYDLGGGLGGGGAVAETVNREEAQQDRNSQTRAGVPPEAGADDTPNPSSTKSATGSHPDPDPRDARQLDAEWVAWAADLEADIAAATSLATLNKLWGEEAALLEQSPDAERLQGVFTDRCADLALDNADDAAAAADGNHSNAAETK